MASNAYSAHRVAIADDSPAFLAAAANYIAGLPGYVLAGTAGNLVDALSLVESAAPDLLLLDLGLMPSRGLDLVRRVEIGPRPPAVVAVGLFLAVERRPHAPDARAPAAIRNGAVLPRLSHGFP